jgi:hypothetical protein
LAAFHPQSWNFCRFRPVAQEFTEIEVTALEFEADGPSFSRTDPQPTRSTGKGLRKKGKEEIFFL